ncbi:MAG: 3-hydroxyacyl-CoA dehydrogenase, partial [bacterium]|nr:3-hydroxyacyl-CoA dehydrogenase [bacterium]
GLSDGGPFPKVQKVFETVAFAKVSMSCKEAVNYGYMKRSDRISLSRDKLLFDAKSDVLEFSKNFQKIPVREDILVPGNGGKNALLSAVEGFKTQGVISEHDGLIASKLAHVLCAGSLPTQGLVSEQYLLDIEREVFLQLCGEEKSQARMQALLTTGKPLRN